MKQLAVVVMALMTVAVLTAVHAQGSVVDDVVAPAAIAADGIGEELLLVIADPAADAGRIEAAFAEVQGFYRAASNDYDATGFFTQSSADEQHVDCPRFGALQDVQLDGVLQTVECPLDRHVLRVLRPVSLAFHERSALRSFADAPRCGQTGHPPCQRERLRRVLRADGSLRHGMQLLVTAFRTRAGAEDFVDLVRTLRAGDAITVTARKLAGGFVGLGQEADPDGTGPLLRPLPDQASYQR